MFIIYLAMRGNTFHYKSSIFGMHIHNFQMIISEDSLTFASCNVPYGGLFSLPLCKRTESCLALMTSVVDMFPTVVVVVVVVCFLGHII